MILFFLYIRTAQATFQLKLYPLPHCATWDVSLLCCSGVLVINSNLLNFFLDSEPLSCIVCQAHTQGGFSRDSSEPPKNAYFMAHAEDCMCWCVRMHFIALAS